MRVRRAPRGVETCWKTEEQHVAQKIEDRFFHGRVTPFGYADCALYDFTIFIARRLTGREVGSVNREAGDGLAHGPRKRLEREIPVPAASLRKPIKHVAQNIDVIRQRELHHLEFFRIQEMAKRNGVTDEAMERLCDRSLG